uniref:C2 domain-containing protein n=1 Tax=Chelydra serpentina TaxID=8475 RepID=A0A8C3S0H3_CHESE
SPAPEWPAAAARKVLLNSSPWAGALLVTCLSLQREKHPYYNLSVKVLRARNIKGTDLLSKADCYVQLRLPTASPITYRTQVVDNSSNPEWNETFQYRIHNLIESLFYWLQ